MPLRAIIFDMDGVLIISEPYVFRAFQHVLAEEGIELTRDLFRNYLGTSLQDKLKAWHRDFGIPEYDHHEFSERLTAVEFRLMEAECKPNAKLQRFLQQAKDAGLKLAVATSSERKRAEHMLGFVGVTGYFDAFVANEDCVKHKPDPEVFLLAAKKLGVDPSECVVIEDAASGLEAAHRAGMKRAAILSVFHPEPYEGILSFEKVDDLTLGMLQAMF